MITRRRFLQGTVLAGVAVVVAPLALPAPAITPAVIPVEAAESLVLQPYQRRLVRLLFGEPQGYYGPRQPIRMIYRRKSGREVLDMVSPAGSMTQWVALSPDESVVIEEGDTIESEGDAILTWYEPGMEKRDYNSLRYEPGSHEL